MKNKISQHMFMVAKYENVLRLIKWMKLDIDGLNSMQVVKLVFIQANLSNWYHYIHES